MRVAAIDVGTNSVHLLVADVAPDGEITIVEKAREQVELGRGGLDRQRLAEDAMERGIAALRLFRTAIDTLEVDDVYATATSAVREAQNGGDFVEAVSRATGIHIRTISGVEEARLIYLGVRPDLDLAAGPALLLDIGGGSVEFILCTTDGILAARSLPLGHIRLTEAHVHHDPPSHSEIALIRDRTEDAVRQMLAQWPRVAAATLVGTGGSVRTLARMATLARGEPEPAHENGLLLARRDIKRLLAQFSTRPRSELGDLPGMDSRRRATVSAAAAMLTQAMKTLGHDELVTSDRSLRDGLLANWIDAHREELDLARTVHAPRMRSVLRLVDRYDADRHHCYHVRDLALSLYDQLGVHGELGPDARSTLGYAALLHDVGHHIDARDHHKHGQYLILHSRMAGFTAREVAIIANIVRYHRSRPKRSHRHFKALSRGHQRLVEVLSAVLRVADALDRSHEQPVVGVRVQHSDRGIAIEALTRNEAHLERWAAERRLQHLSNVLARPVTLSAQPFASRGAGRAETPSQVE